jgi:hypothetical protein
MRCMLQEDTAAAAAAAAAAAPGQTSSHGCVSDVFVIYLHACCEIATLKHLSANATSPEAPVLERHIVLRGQSRARLEHVLDAGALPGKRVDYGSAFGDLQRA